MLSGWRFVSSSRLSMCGAESSGTGGPTAVGGVPAHPGEGDPDGPRARPERRAVTCDDSAHGPFLRARARPCVYMR